MTAENYNQSKTKAITKTIRDASKTMSDQSEVRAKPNANIGLVLVLLNQSGGRANAIVCLLAFTSQ